MILAPATPQLNVVYKSITLLAPYPYNARTHSKAQIRKIAESIRSFGFTNPVLIDGENTIVAGHGRVDAARLLGIEQVPTILLDTLTKQQIRAYVIADNRLALDAGWDPSILRIELQNLVFENEIDISLTGFEVGEIDLIVNAQDPACDGADNIPEEQPITVTQLGDLWQLAEHRVLCGDARAESAFVTLMGGLQASVIFSDPPYNVAIEGHASGNGNIHHPEFAMACGEMDEIEFTAFLTSVLGNLARSSKKGSVHYICMDWRHLRELLAAGYKTYDSLLNVCVWVKNTGGMGSQPHQCMEISGREHPFPQRRGWKSPGHAPDRQTGDTYR
jgi:hypothetical protein